MEKKPEKNHPDRWLKDLPATAGNSAFKSEEMILCAECRRTNPPTRLDCFYCGAQIEFDEAQSHLLRPNLREPEIWENAFNLVYSPDSQILDDEKAAEIAKILKSEPEFLFDLISTKKALPLARVESAREAEIVQKRLFEFGVKTLILSDENLEIKKTSHRLRGMKFLDDKIVFALFNRDELFETANEEVNLIVTGAIFERRVESTEKRDKKGGNKILQSHETASDEFLIDVYTRRETLGYRIFAKGFDFSCLGREKGLLAAENLNKLARQLRQAAPGAKLVEDYLSQRGNLGKVWRVEERIDSQGLKREGFGKFNLGSVTTINNLSQFTKYSRMLRQLL